MKNRISIGLTVMLLILTATSCSPKSNTNTSFNESSSQSSQQEINSPDLITTEDYLRTLSNEEKCWMNITPEQYLDDYDMLYQQLTENYPYFGVAQRKYSVDIKQQYEQYRERVSGCNNDDEFWQLIRGFINEMQYTGHIAAWGYRYMSQVEGMRDFVLEYPEYEDKFKSYLDKLDNEVSQKNYVAMQKFYQEIDAAVEALNSTANGQSDNGLEDNPDFEEPEYNNVTTKIIEDGKTAYIKIDVFDMSLFKADKETLFSFYDSVIDFEHIIIDITENPGGGMDYFNQLVVAPLTTKTLEVPNYQLIKGGSLNLHYLRVEEGLKDGTWQPICELPKMEDINQSDLADMDYFEEEVYNVHPSGNGFQGHIWLLVSENNYSSSEYAAMFSKQSGFATLVGTQTGGDGIGVDPTYIILPNSGLVIQYSPVYGVTSDGKNSEEYGTTPDITIEEGKTALETCLHVIDTMK